jgi:DNA processing protein
VSIDPVRVRLARVAFGHLVEPGRRDLGELIRRHGPVEALRRIRDGAANEGLVAAAAPRLAAGDPYELAERALERAERLGARIVTPEDAEYPDRVEQLVLISVDGPDRLRRDTYPPTCIWVRGAWELAEACERSVAVVGARACTAYGEHVARDLAYGVAERGWTVISGGAFGIDAAAHRGALAADGRTVAVLACGIDRPYPPGHEGLFDRIAETGLVMSEWPPGADPHRHRFLVRNRFIAAATLGTVMVEAHARSGAAFTLERAGLLNRVVMAVPGPVTSAASIGCHRALRESNAILVAGAAHVIDAVGPIGLALAPPEWVPANDQDRLTSLQARVLDGVRPRKILTAEEIAAAVGVSDRDARAALPELVLAGFVVVVGAGYRLGGKRDRPAPEAVDPAGPRTETG